MMFAEMAIDTFDTNQMRKISSEIKIVEKKEGKEEDFNNKSQADFFTKTNDLATIYLTEMGSISLLTHEAEGQIARRIENGLKWVSDVILQSPITIKEFIQIRRKAQKWDG